ncbi:MAG: hypothetical protein ACRD5J_19355 [Nitrososphaeraceae archaeon]
MNFNYFYIKLPHKDYYFIRTESRFFEISESEILSNRLVPNAVHVPDLIVADLIGQAERQQRQHKPRGKASKIRRFQSKEVSV